MLYVENDGTIRLTRGDSALIEVLLKNILSDAEFVMSPTDKLTMTVRKTPNKDKVVFQKVSTGSSSFHIQPEDTAGWKFGDYTYDVQLMTDTGDVYTVVEPTVFEIMPEVTY